MKPPVALIWRRSVRYSRPPLSASLFSSNCPGIDHVNPNPFKVVHISCRDRRFSTSGCGRYLAVGMIDGTPGRAPSSGFHGVAWAAALPKGRMRPSKSSRSIPSTTSSSLSRLLPGGRISTPYSNSASLTVDRNRFGAACPATQATTLELGLGRISSETILVSRMITLSHVNRIEAVCGWVIGEECPARPRLEVQIWHEWHSPDPSGLEAGDRVQFSGCLGLPLQWSNRSQVPACTAGSSAFLRG